MTFTICNDLVFGRVTKGPAMAIHEYRGHIP